MIKLIVLMFLATATATATIPPKAVVEEQVMEEQVIEGREYIGEFEITAYAGDSITATGTTPVPYRTVAVDPSVIPLGTTLYIEGVGCVTAEDTGGAVKGSVIDLYLPGTETDTKSWGRQQRQVWKVN